MPAMVCVLRRAKPNQTMVKPICDLCNGISVTVDFGELHKFMSGNWNTALQFHYISYII